MHPLMAATMERAIEDIRQIQKNARSHNDTTRPRWPMIVLKSPKGWTGPKVVDGLQIEGTFRAHRWLCWSIPSIRSRCASGKLDEELQAGELFDEMAGSCRNWPSWPEGNRRMA